MEMLSNWNEERMGRLETLYRDGLSFSLIAADIGVSRNAAIGKAHRMNLPKRVEIVQCKAHPRIATDRPKRRRRSAVNIAKPRPVLMPDPRYRCSINELRNCSCRYPLWPANAAHHQRLYCGCPDASLSDDIPYCRHHALLCEMPPR